MEMPDRHLNLFTCYQAARLEDNLTRAFIVTLKACPEHLTWRLLEQLAGIPRGKSTSAFLYDLQAWDGESLPRCSRGRSKVLPILSDPDESGPIEPDATLDEEHYKTLADRINGKRLRQALRRVQEHAESAAEVAVLLGTTTEWLKEHVVELMKLADELARESRADAWIVADDACVLIESKLGRTVYRSQLERHLRDLEDQHGQSQGVSCVGDSEIAPSVTWQQVYRLLDAALSVDDPRRWIVDQFLQYLRLLGLSPFLGISREDFDPDSETRRLRLKQITRRWRGPDPADGRMAQLDGLPIPEWISGDADCSLTYPDCTIGNTGLIFWKEPVLRLKLVVGSKRKAQTDALLRAYDRGAEPISEAILAAQDECGVPATGEVVIRFKNASWSASRPAESAGDDGSQRPLRWVLKSKGDIAELMQALKAQHLCQRLRREEVQRRFSQVRLSKHQDFYVSAFVTLYWEIPAEQVVAWREAVVDELRDRCNAVYRVLRAMSGVGA